MTAPIAVNPQQLCGKEHGVEAVMGHGGSLKVICSVADRMLVTALT